MELIPACPLQVPMSSEGSTTLHESFEAKPVATIPCEEVWKSAPNTTGSSVLAPATPIASSNWRFSSSMPLPVTI
eukprot:13795792-Heterocapsa_arctica.AAC.1